MQGGKLPKVHGVDIGAMPDEKLCHFKVSVGAGIVQWHEPTLVLCVDVRPVLQDQLDDPGAVVAGGQVERGGLPPVGGVAVDVERREERHELVLVAAARGLQQLVLLELAEEDQLGLGVGDVDGRLPLGVADGGVGAVLQEEDADVRLALDGGLVQGSVVPAVSRVGLGASLDGL